MNANLHYIIIFIIRIIYFCPMQQKIALIGGPGTGKSSILNELSLRKYLCMPEISREVTLQAQKEGIDQLFLTKPLLFSDLLLKGREKQYLDAKNSDASIVFFDRGIPDVHAYLDYIKVSYPQTYIDKSKQYIYDKIFIMPPWEKIYTSDNERYENFEQAIKIHEYLKNTYQNLGYQIHLVPFGNVEERTNYILDSLKCEI